MMSAMNITYKTPCETTDVYDYIHVYTVRNQKVKQEERRMRREELDFFPFGIFFVFTGQKTKQKKAATFSFYLFLSKTGRTCFFGDKLNVPKVYRNVKTKVKVREKKEKQKH